MSKAVNPYLQSRPSNIIIPIVLSKYTRLIYFISFFFFDIHTKTIGLSPLTWNK